MSEGEYEVESIVRAKVEPGKRGKRAHWLYCVKWKNYDAEDNTWEPAASFDGGSEHFIDRFWGRINTNGRDFRDIHLFKADEEFLPVGPPGKKKIKKAKPKEERDEIPPSSPVLNNVDSESEVRSIITDENQASPSTRVKRRRSSVGVEAEPAAPKRKRGRPPGIRPAELEAKEREAAEAHSSEHSIPEQKQEESPRGREPAVAESSKPAPRRLSLPRRRKLHKQNHRLSASADELLLVSDDKEKGKARTPLAKKGGTSAEDAMDVDEIVEGPLSPFGIPSLLDAEPAPPEALPEAPPALPLPAHRLRAANPRIKLTDDPNLTEMSGAIAVKARFMKRSTNNEENGIAGGTSPARPMRSRPGPGRSSDGLIVGGSRLTFQKGKLTTVKPRRARAVKVDAQQNSDAQQGAGGFAPLQPAGLEVVPGLGQLQVDDLTAEPQQPPTGQELLDAAGLNAAAADALPDFEEDADGEVEPEHIRPNSQNEQAGNAPVRAFGSDQVNGNTDQAPVLEAKPLTFASRVTAAWNQSTIFGPLALGFTNSRTPAESESANTSSHAKKYTFHLNLDPAVSLPVAFKDVQASQSFLDGIDSGARNPTGKFYKEEHAIAMIGTLKAQGSYARVSLSDDSNDDQKQHFDRFISRMHAGELFIQMNRAELLVMCGSDNLTLGQKLGFPTHFLGLGGAVVVAHVNIEDHCQYAEAAVNADNSRW